MSDTAELESKLKYFEERADVSDPEQKRMLDEMREHLSRLKQLRGDWNKPSTFRLWNDPAPTGKVEAPLAIDSFRAYKQHVDAEHSLLGAPTPPQLKDAPEDGL
ncbi:hypothetical protein H632_c91p2 [Helicosporidium sp. ATCC 50920]|nr:hypothetical protein H632_c91p2 [Helicosporidium sp. ATCC 50920]|eukprot:KDD76836.1 hypothetical protein H632_c91p2 [Helicosporidium sp. ATCC 50920]